MIKKVFFIASLVFCMVIPAMAEEDGDNVDLKPKVHGTIRGKYEYQT